MKEEDVFRNHELPPLFRAARAAMSDGEAAVADVLRPHRGIAHPVARREIERVTGLTDREVKAAIATLARDHGWKIGRLRGNPGGYFVVETAADAEAAMLGYWRQAVTMVLRAREWMSPEERLEYLGQMRAALVDGKGEAQGED